MKNYIINENIKLKFEGREIADEYTENTLKLNKYIIKQLENGQIWEYEITKTGYKYRITSMEKSSDKYGVCECCNKHVSEVFYQNESKYFEYEENGEIEKGYSEYKCKSYFGHKECLESKRR